jgi:amino acid permease
VGDASKPGIVTTVLRGHASIPSIMLTRPVIMALVLVFFILPVSLQCNLNSMKFTSMYSFTYAALFVLTTIVLAVLYWAEGHNVPIRWLPAAGTNAIEMVAKIPAIMSAFICHYNIHPLMAKPTNELPV